MAFGSLLKKKREDRQLSQKMLAQQAKIASDYVSRIESGSRFPSRDTVDRLSDALSLDGPEKDVFYASAGLLSDDLYEIIINDPQVAYLVRRWIALPEAQWDYLMSLVDSTELSADH